jgi:molybdate transport system regulatory protein
MTDPVVRIRLDFGTRCSVGPGKIALLEAIARTGSLARAARDLGMSYRYAWALIGDLNRSFRKPVAGATVGGRAGGGATLTTFGRTLVKAYRDLEIETDKRARRQFAAVTRQVAVKNPRTPIRRRLRRTGHEGS